MILEKNRKSVKLEKSGHYGLLHRSLGNPRHDVDLHRSVGHPRHGEAGVPKWHPSGTPRRSGATPR